MKSTVRQSGIVVKPVLSIKEAIPQVIEGGAMPLVRAGLGLKGKLTARITSVLRGVGGTLSSELLKGIYRNQRLRGPKGSRSRHGPACSGTSRCSVAAKCPRSRADVCTNAIHCIVVLFGALS